jgi:hypothetical protein
MADTHCPKCQRVRIEFTGPQDSCPHCGIIYAKYRAKQLADATTLSPIVKSVFDDVEEEYRWPQKILEPWRYIAERVSIEVLLGRALVWVLFVIWSIYFLRAGLEWEKIGSSFLHNVNLPFHEFGHVFFRPFGYTLTVLGGSLFQILMPFGITLLFVYRQKETFGASITLWWCGQNWVDLAPYVDDAPYRSLPLTTGNESGHDWGNLLTQWNALDQAHHLAQLSRRIGLFIMFIALAWGLWILWQQKNNKTNEFVPDC